MAMAASGQKSNGPSTAVTPQMVPRQHVYGQPVNPVIEPTAAKPVMTKNFAAPAFSCRPTASDFEGGRCGY